MAPRPGRGRGSATTPLIRILTAALLLAALSGCSPPPSDTASASLALEIFGLRGTERGTLVLSAAAETPLPPETLWNVFTLPEAWSGWSPLIVSARWADQPGWRQGRKIELTSDLGFLLGRKTRLETVGAVVPGASVIFWDGDREGGSCQVWIFERRPGGGSKVQTTLLLRERRLVLLKPLVAGHLQRRLDRAVKGLAAAAGAPPG